MIARRLFLPLLLLPLFATSAWADKPQLRVGILAFRGAERAETEWQSTLNHLAQDLPEYSVQMVALDLAGLTQAVRDQTVDFAITNPGHYVELESAYGIIRIASMAASADTLPARTVASAVIVRADRKDLRTLADLRGAHLAAVAPDAFGGFRIVWRELAEHHIDPFSDTAALSFLGFPMERIVEAVAARSVDAGIVRGCLLEQMAAEGHLRMEDFHVLDARIPSGTPCQVSTRLYPDWPFAKLAHTPDRLAKRVALALMSMPGDNGTAWTVPVDYQPVHDLFRALKIGPYDYLNHPTLRKILHDNWPWLVIALLAALWWLIHVARVEYLIRRRTDELKRAHEQARLQREEMEHGARLALLGEMASSLAHEINQPLAAIANYANGCERRLVAGTDPEGISEGVRLISQQAERAAGIVRKVRAFVRKRASDPQVLDVNEPIREALSLFQATASRHCVRVAAVLSPALPPVLADRIQIEQVVLNLLQNAADAMKDSPMREIQVHSARNTALVEISVTDTGPGLAPEVRERLFEPFFTTKADGLGLGLSLSRSIIEAHGGHLLAENAADGGAVFRFALPAALIPPAEPEGTMP